MLLVVFLTSPFSYFISFNFLNFVTFNFLDLNIFLSVFCSIESFFFHTWNATHFFTILFLLAHFRLVGVGRCS